MNMAENYANDLISKELKKLMYSFNTVSSRMMRVSYEEYNMILKKIFGIY